MQATLSKLKIFKQISLKIKKATKLNKAAHTTAWNGVSTLVETIVAIELAASWKPLIKSNAIQRKMMAISIMDII